MIPNHPKAIVAQTAMALFIREWQKSLALPPKTQIKSQIYHLRLVITIQQKHTVFDCCIKRQFFIFFDIFSRKMQ